VVLKIGKLLHIVSQRAGGLTYHFSAQLRKLFQVLIMNPVAIYHFLLKVFSCIIFVVYDQMVISLGEGGPSLKSW